jgi:hypothetical protein
MAHSTARERVRVAAKAVGMVLVVAALASAKVSYAKVRLFAQYLTAGTREAFERDEAWLVEEVRKLDVAATKTFLVHWAARVDPEGFERDDQKRYEARRAFLSETIDGMVVLNAGLTPEAGIIFVALLDKIAAQLHEDDCRVGDAAASRRTPAQLRHDALLELANRAAAYDPNTGRRATPLMNVTVGLEPMAAGEGIATRTGPPLSAATARRLACSAAMARVLFDPQGQVLDFGRRRRLFTATQAESLFLRFGGCAFPGCDRPPSWCQIHHILEWERDHGPTDLANGVPLCSHHHHCVHEGGFTIKTTEHGLEWFRPDNSLIEALWLPTAA